MLKAENDPNREESLVSTPVESDVLRSNQNLSTRQIQ